MWTFAYFESYFVPLDDLDLTTLCYTVDEMYLASLINKGREAYISGTTNPTALPSETVLKMATINGAKAVLWDNEIGSLEVGKKADLVVVNPFTWSMVPLHDRCAPL
jgi:cytosine/adenosine deaminase-related metal-dependent hydrolase